MMAKQSNTRVRVYAGINPHGFYKNKSNEYKLLGLLQGGPKNKTNYTQLWQPF